jgi:adenylate kinase family enzyme
VSGGPSGVRAARRIAVVGPPGSGKSFVAGRLAQATGLPLVHMDRLAYRPGWQETPRDELLRLHQEWLERAEWVIDGNYTNVGKAERIAHADVVVVLALPRRTCMARILRRTSFHRGRVRPDMAEGCAERLDLAFLRFCWDWHSRHSDYGEEIVRQAGSTPVIVLRSRREVDAFLDQVMKAPPPR